MHLYLFFTFKLNSSIMVLKNLAILAYVQSLFPEQWQQRVNLAKTSVKFWPTLCGLNVKVTSMGSIRNGNRCNASFLVGQSKVLNNHSVSTSIALSYV